MKNPEKDAIEFCKLLIEQRYRFERENGILRQRDLEYLADRIEEKSGIKLSLSTLKRIWRKDSIQIPHATTLNAIVSLLGYPDWQEFRLKNAQPTTTRGIEPSTNTPTTSPAHGKSAPSKLWTVVTLVALLLAVVWLIGFQSTDKDGKEVFIKGPVSFTGNKTVAQGVPATIIFNYDVTRIEADSFFFQQSWSERQKTRIDPSAHYHSTIYYYPGFHIAKLFANDSVVGRFNAHITTDGWKPIVSYSFYDDQLPIYVRNNSRQISGGALQVTRNDLIASGIDINRSFTLGYFNVREFEKTHSDNFSVETRIMYDSTSTPAGCAGLEFHVMCERDVFFVRLMDKGCERDLLIKIGEIIVNGSTDDLSALSSDIHQWNELRIKVANKKATVYLNQRPVKTIVFKKEFGDVKGLAYYFNGTGVVDRITLKNGEDLVVMDDEF